MLKAAFATAPRSELPSGWALHRVILRPPRRPGGNAGPVFEPPTDLYETTDNIVVRVEIAGLAAENIEVALSSDGRVLTISGRRDDPGAGSPRKYYTMEIESGNFYRQLLLPRPVDAEAVSASYSEGFLEVVLPKRGHAQPARRQVPIE